MPRPPKNRILQKIRSDRKPEQFPSCLLDAPADRAGSGLRGPVQLKPAKNFVLSGAGPRPPLAVSTQGRIQSASDECLIVPRSICGDSDDLRPDAPARGVRDRAGDAPGAPQGAARAGRGALRVREPGNGAQRAGNRRSGPGSARSGGSGRAGRPRFRPQERRTGPSGRFRGSFPRGSRQRKRAALCGPPGGGRGAVRPVAGGPRRDLAARGPGGSCSCRLARSGPRPPGGPLPGTSPGFPDQAPAPVRDPCSFPVIQTSAWSRRPRPWSRPRCPLPWAGNIRTNRRCRHKST